MFKVPCTYVVHMTEVQKRDTYVRLGHSASTVWGLLAPTHNIYIYIYCYWICTRI